VKIGLQIPDFTGPGAARLGADLATVARTADDAGFEFISVMDHFFQINMVGPPEHDMLEAYTTLGYLAGCTSRAKLVTLVTGTVYRHPGILAKIVTTLDVLSGGRAWLWHRRRLERRGIQGPGHSVPAGRRAVRAAGGDTPDLPADVERRRGALPGQALSAGAPAELPEGAVRAASADPDRRLRREEDAAVRRQVRAGVQPVPRPGPGPQARRAARALRRRGRDYDEIEKTCYFIFDVGAKGRRPARSSTNSATSPDWASGPRSARWRASGMSLRWRSSGLR